MNVLAQGLVDNLRMPVAVVTDAGTIGYSNVCFKQTFGSDAAGWIGTAARTVGGQRGWLQGFFIPGGIVRSVDVEFNGRSYRVDRTELPTTENSVVALIFEDVTRQREAEQAKSDFTSMIVHDLRGPLSGIQGTLDFILGGDTSKFDPIHEELLREASHESERMMSLINELLDFSKIESGNFEVEKDEVRLAGIVKRSVASLQSVAARDEVLLAGSSASDLPMIEGSAEKLTQAVINLVSNSVKFTPKKGVIAVAANFVRSAANGDSVVVTVTDTGCGMPAEDLEKIFEKYKQSKSKSHRGGGGTGLGLYIVKQIIEAHGGEVKVTSIQGIGTSMVLRLPVRRVAA